MKKDKAYYEEQAHIRHLVRHEKAKSIMTKEDEVKLQEFVRKEWEKMKAERAVKSDGA